MPTFYGFGKNHCMLNDLSSSYQRKCGFSGIGRIVTGDIGPIGFPFLSIKVFYIPKNRTLSRIHWKFNRYSCPCFKFFNGKDKLKIIPSPNTLYTRAAYFPTIHYFYGLRRVRDRVRNLVPLRISLGLAWIDPKPLGFPFRLGGVCKVGYIIGFPKGKYYREIHWNNSVILTAYILGQYFTGRNHDSFILLITKNVDYRFTSISVIEYYIHSSQGNCKWRYYQFNHSEWFKERNSRFPKIQCHRILLRFHIARKRTGFQVIGTAIYHIPVKIFNN